MRKTLWVLLLMIGVSVPVRAAEPEFSADMTMTMGGKATPGKVYTSQKKIRYELAEGVSITHLDQNVTYVLLPSQKIYMKQSIDREALAQVGAVSQGETERVPMGQEMVSGRNTQKFRVSYAEQGGKTTSMYQWMDGELPIKIESVDGSWGVEYSNMRPGRQDDSLFEVPSDYKEFETPQMPANLEGMMGAGESLQGMDMDTLKKMMADMQSGPEAGEE